MRNECKTMKKIAILLLLVILASSVGCTKDSKPAATNTGTGNKDYQYSFCNIPTGDIPVQKGDGGYYFNWNSYLYFIDENTLKIAPLCNKANCLHDKERDDYSDVDECNAYLLDSLGNTDYFYIDDKLYTLKDESYFEGKKLIVINSIYESNPDRTESKKIFTIRDEIVYWIMHRGMIYYITDPESDVKKYSLSDKKTEVCFDLADTKLYNAEINRFYAYNDNLYYFVSGYKDEQEFKSMISGSDNSPFEYIYVCAPDGKQKYRVESELSRDGIVFQGFSDGKILYTDADYDKGIKYLYSMDQNGKSTKLDFKFKNIFDSYCEDDEFSYVRIGKTIDDIEKNIYEVYDKKGKFITSIDFPDGYPNLFMLGDNKYLFYLEDTEKAVNLYCLDKEKLKNGDVDLHKIYSKK